MRMILVAVLGLAFSAPASAQQLTLTFHEGRVTLDAAAVPVRTILSEWGRLGGTKVVGAERITGAPLTIHLENVTEAQALEVVLRNVAGYMAAPRRAASASGASAYDRILVMPTSAAAAAAAANTGRPAPTATTPTTGRHAARRPGRRAATAAGGRTGDAGRGGRRRQRARVHVPAAESLPGDWPARTDGQPGPFGTPIPPGSQSPVVQFGPGTGGQAVTVNPTQEQQMPVMQFPGAAPAGNGAHRRVRRGRFAHARHDRAARDARAARRPAARR